MPFKPTNRAFTLVETSVVLVVAAVIIVVFLTARVLIQTYQIKSIALQLHQYNTAVDAFYAKYGGIPGDFDQAEKYGLGVPGGAPFDSGPGRNGNGDSLLKPTESDYENLNFWYHLTRANMLPGSYGSTFEYGAGTPATKIRDVGIRVLTPVKTLANYFIIGSHDAIPFKNPHVHQLTPYEAYHLDKQLDDGAYATGKVIGSGKECATTQSPVEYDVDQSEPRCNLRVEMTGGPGIDR